MRDDDDFFKRLGVEHPGEGMTDEKKPDMEKVEGGLRDLIRMVGTIRKEAIRAGFTSDEAFELASSYYQMFLSINFLKAQADSGIIPDGEG